MSAWKKLASAPAASGGLNVEELFSTYLHEGDSTTKNIVNGIDLQNEGGLVISKSIDNAVDWGLYDTETGASKEQNFDQGIPADDADSVTAFNSNGFTVGADVQTNQTARGTYCTWTFRKAPKFFDIVTYTGNGVPGRTVSHNLGSVPGSIWVKRTDATGYSWTVYHRGIDATAPEDYAVNLNNTLARTDSTFWDDTAPTSSVFTVGSNVALNASGGTYIAYIFAHNDGDGGFGPTGDQDIIKCGSWIGNGTQPSGISIDLGFEPQFIMWKRVDATGEWYWVDDIRGFNVTSQGNKYLSPNTTSIQSTGDDYIFPRPTGFDIEENLTVANANGGRYIYMAIRRGPMAVPTASTDVFAIDDRDNYNTAPQTGYGYQSNFPVDLLIRNGYIGVYNDGGFEAADILNARLLQGYYLTTNENAGKSGDGGADFDHMNGCYEGGTADTKNIGLMWRRAPKFFDIATHRGTGVAKTVPHNLGAVPEMMISKIHSGASDWAVYHKDQDATAPQDYFLELNRTQAPTNNDGWWNDTAPTDTVFTVNDNPGVNQSGDDYIVLLFATLSGISKVGSYTGTGSTLNVDCGFSTGARFVLIKRIDATGDWYAFNSQTGIVAGNDYYAKWNVNATYSNSDFIDPLNSGFTVTSTAPADLNANGGTYIFYAVA